MEAARLKELEEQALRKQMNKKKAKEIAEIQYRVSHVLVTLVVQISHVPLFILVILEFSIKCIFSPNQPHLLNKYQINMGF